MLQSISIPTVPPGFQPKELEYHKPNVTLKNNPSFNCSNCGKSGHSFHLCKITITSYGVVCFRITPSYTIEYLMIRRKDTLGYIDFMRGKYSIRNKDYIMNMMKQMTIDEKHALRTLTFSQLWKKLWESDEWATTKTAISQYNNEEYISKDKFSCLQNGVHGQTYYNLFTLLDESEKYGTWEEPEWGFPKGRRNYQEKDYDCAIREFCEETGYKPNLLIPLKNVLPYEESFIGSNYKAYKHKYYLKYMNYQESGSCINDYQTSEVGKMEWKSYDECMRLIRPYNVERIRMLDNIHQLILKQL